MAPIEPKVPGGSSDRPSISFARSIAAKLVLVTVLFLVVPTVLYWRFQTADEARREFMLDSIRARGALIAQALANTLGTADVAVFSEVSNELALYSSDDLRLRLLFNPLAEPGLSDFFYVASSPAPDRDQLEEERRYLKESGLLSDVWSSCTEMVESSRLTNTSEDVRELIVSLTPIRTASGCWVLIASLSADDPVSVDLVEPYWSRPEVMVAAVVYLTMAMVLILVLVDLRVGLRRFERLARTSADEGHRQSFEESNRLPELAEVARQFDAMVQRLKEVATLIRGTAEEQVHAMKNPIGTIAQSVEALRTAIPPENERAQRMLGIIDQSRHRLTNLIVAGQQATEAAARMAAPPREPVQIDALLHDLCADFEGPCETRGVHLVTKIDDVAVVLGSDEMIESVLENVVENAVSFSPVGGTVQVALSVGRGRVRITVRDEGPGAPVQVLDRLFEKGFSQRPTQHGEANAETHFGLGMWIVRRNVEALGGTVIAANRKTGGLDVVIDLPAT